MGFKDIIKKSVIEGFQTDITTAKIIVTLGIVVFLGIYIYTIYKVKTKSSFYSKDFNTVLAILPTITAGIVLAMQSNIVISLGMVGALSIVRFRNAVKSSMDLMFLFWAISIGIICGGGIYELALIVSFVITLLLFLLEYIPVKKQSLLLIVNGDNVSVENEIVEVLKKYTKHYKVKSRSIHSENIDLIIEIRSKKNIEIAKECSVLKNVLNISLLSHDGEERI